MGRLVRVLALTCPWLLCQAEPSLAHQPHDPIGALALSPSFPTDGTVFAVVDFFSLGRSTDGGFTWTSLARGIDATTPFSAIAVSTDYAADRTLFVATRGDGIYRSQDAGSTWQKAKGGLATQDITLVLCSGDFLQQRIALAADAVGGLYRTIDAGLTWSSVLKSRARITAAAFSPAFASDQLVAAGDGEGRLYYSRDRGETWVERSPALTAFPISAIAFSPAFGRDGTIFLGVLGGGVYRSSNRGASFTPVNIGIADRRVTDVALSPAFASDSTLFASGSDEGVFRSTNRGLTWGKFDAGICYRLQGTSHYLFLRVSSGFHADGVVFLGAFEGLFRSDDRGRTWPEVETLKPVDEITGVAVSPSHRTDQVLFLSTYGGGAYRRSGTEGAWTIHNRGLERPYLYDITVSPGFASDQTVFAVQAGFVVKSVDGGATWERREISPVEEVFPTKIALPHDYPADRTLFLGSRYGGIYRSTDDGRTFENVLPTAGHVISVALSPDYATDGVVFAGTRSAGVFRSTDRGDTWYPAGIGLRPETIVQIALSPAFATDQVLFAGCVEGLFRSSDGGATWAAVTVRGDLAGRAVVALAVSPEYAADRRILAALRGAGLFESTDDGASWAEIGADLAASGHDLRRIEFSPAFGDDRTIYGSAVNNLFRSIDGGRTWVTLAHPARYESSNDLIHYTSDWGVRAHEGASSGEVAFTRSAEGQCRFRFVGTAIAWIGPRAPTLGISRVSVDGVPVAEVDQYGPSPTHIQSLFSLSGQSSGPHLLQIDATGTRNPAAIDAAIVVDGFDLMR